MGRVFASVWTDLAGLGVAVISIVGGVYGALHWANKTWRNETREMIVQEIGAEREKTRTVMKAEINKARLDTRKMVSDELAPLSKRLAAVEEELKPNSGKTLRDDVKKILKLIEAGEPRTGTL